MPKQKTHSGASKRFRLTASGKLKRKKMNRNHILTKRSNKRMRHLKQGGYVDATQESTIKKMIPYAK